MHASALAAAGSLAVVLSGLLAGCGEAGSTTVGSDPAPGRVPEALTCDSPQRVSMAPPLRAEGTVHGSSSPEDAVDALLSSSGPGPAGWGADFALSADRRTAWVLRDDGTAVAALDLEQVDGVWAVGGYEACASERDEALVSCGGGPGWPPSVMAEGVPGVLTDAEARAAFRSLLDDPRTGVELAMTLFRDGPDVEWRVLRADGDDLLVGTGPWTDRGPQGPDAYVLSLRREASGWSTDGWGQCRLEPVLGDDEAWVRVERYAVTGARTLEVTGSEMQCASGRDPEPFVHEPQVVEDATSVTVVWTTTPVEGAQTCQGNPPATRTVRLDAELGDRTVLDGSVHPARPVPR